jgi:hypothetical protein
VTIVLGLVFWVATQGFGLILTGAATDPNSGPLIVLLALACWPPVRARGLAQARTAAPRASRRVEPGAQRLSFDFALHIGKRL